MYQTQGIIIKKQNKGENDKLITFFTKDYGKIVLIVRGVRKNTSKLSGHLEFLTFSEIGFVLGKVYKVLTSAIEIDRFSSIKNNLKKLKIADHMSDLIFKYTQFEEKDDKIFNLVSSAFTYLDEKKFSDLELEYLLRYFEYKFLTILGYQPNEKFVLDFFSEKTADKKSLENIRLVFLRYFESIL